MKNQICRRAIKGFTLIEILIVLAIVIFLSAILVGVFSRVRENGRRAVCLDNLKHLSLGLQQYVQDNDSKFPTNVISVDPLLPYVKDEKFFQCPSAAPYNPTYGLTPWLRTVDYKAQKVYGRHENTVADTTTTISFFEFTDKEDMQEIEPTCGITQVGVRHFNGADYAFVDGHVKWLSSIEFAQLGCSANSWQGYSQ